MQILILILVIVLVINYSNKEPDPKKSTENKLESITAVVDSESIKNIKTYDDLVEINSIIEPYANEAKSIYDQSIPVRGEFEKTKDFNKRKELQKTPSISIPDILKDRKFAFVLSGNVSYNADKEAYVFTDNEYNFVKQKLQYGEVYTKVISVKYTAGISENSVYPKLIYFSSDNIFPDKFQKKQKNSGANMNFELKIPIEKAKSYDKSILRALLIGKIDDTFWFKPTSSLTNFLVNSSKSGLGIRYIPESGNEFLNFSPENIIIYDEKTGHIISKLI